MKFPTRIRNPAEEAKRAIARRKRKARAQKLLAQGWKPAAVALEVGVHERTALRYRTEMCDGQDK